MNRAINNIGINETPMFPRVKFDPEPQRPYTRSKWKTIFSVTALSSLPKGQWLLPVEREAIEN